jgi:hypothetical protein
VLSTFYHAIACTEGCAIQHTLHGKFQRSFCRFFPESPGLDAGARATRQMRAIAVLDRIPVAKAMLQLVPNQYSHSWVCCLKCNKNYCKRGSCPMSMRECSGCFDSFCGECDSCHQWLVLVIVNNVRIANRCCIDCHRLNCKDCNALVSCTSCGSIICTECSRQGGDDCDWSAKLDSLAVHVANATVLKYVPVAIQIM